MIIVAFNSIMVSVLCVVTEVTVVIKRSLLLIVALFTKQYVFVAVFFQQVLPPFFFILSWVVSVSKLKYILLYSYMYFICVVPATAQNTLEITVL